MGYCSVDIISKNLMEIDRFGCLDSRTINPHHFISFIFLFAGGSLLLPFSAWL